MVVVVGRGDLVGVVVSCVGGRKWEKQTLCENEKWVYGCQSNSWIIDWLGGIWVVDRVPPVLGIGRFGVFGGEERRFGMGWHRQGWRWRTDTMSL